MSTMPKLRTSSPVSGSPRGARISGDALKIIGEVLVLEHAANGSLLRTTGDGGEDDKEQS